jgi:hypothetical protein
MVSEPREYVRFLAKNNAYISLGRGFTRVGTIKDVSLGGVAFEYVIIEDLDQKHTQQLDIFVSGNGFNLSNVPCTIVYDISLGTLNSNYTFSTLIISKRCGVKFCEVTEEQTVQLKFFLENHTTGLAP